MWSGDPSGVARRRFGPFAPPSGPGGSAVEPSVVVRQTTERRGRPAGHPHFVVRSLPVALFIYHRSDWGTGATQKFRRRMDALKRCDRAPPAARARGRSRGHAVTYVLPSFESCRNPPGPGPVSVWYEGISTRDRLLQLELARGRWNPLGTCRDPDPLDVKEYNRLMKENDNFLFSRTDSRFSAGK